MDSAKLLEWLKVEKKMSARSAKDVLSRCSRVYRILGVDCFDDNTLDILQNSDEFKSSSMFIKSQLKRAVTLCLEFTKNTETE